MTLRGVELDEITKVALSTAEEAGALLLQGLDKPKQLAYKGDVDLVTEYDTRAEAFIQERLLSRFPKFSLIAEENGESNGLDKKQRWIVDPLDGTTNFAHGHPLFAVSIGLEDEGSLVAGVIVVPALGLSFHARLGGGAYCNGGRICVSQQTKLENSLIASGFPYDRRTSEDNNVSEWSAFVRRSQGNRRCGSASIDLAFVARGIYDGYFEPKLAPWDIAAGIVVVREANGRVTDYDGGPIDPFKGWVVASNGRIHSEILAVIQDARSTRVVGSP